MLCDKDTNTWHSHCSQAHPPIHFIIRGHNEHLLSACCVSGDVPKREPLPLTSQLFFPPPSLMGSAHQTTSGHLLNVGPWKVDEGAPWLGPGGTEHTRCSHRVRAWFLHGDHKPPPDGSSKAPREAGSWEVCSTPSPQGYSGEKGLWGQGVGGHSAHGQRNRSR